MPDETEPTPATDDERPPSDTERGATASSGVRVPNWLAVGVLAVALAGGGFAVGRATASDHHGGLVPIGDNRPGGGPGGRGGFGGGGDLGGRGGGPGHGFGGDNSGPDAGGASGNGGSNNAPTTPSTTPGTGSTGT